VQSRRFASFTVKTPRSSSTALRMSDAQLGFPGAPTGGNEPEVFSLDLPFQRFEGGDTLRTWKMPQDGERVEYVVKTNGRPMKAKIELWQGPIRKTHELTIDMQDGDKTPFRAILKYKKGPQVLKISNIGPYEFPLMAAVHVPTNERAEKLRKMTEDLFEKSPKEFVQGGPGGCGLLRPLWSRWVHKGRSNPHFPHPKQCKERTDDCLVQGGKWKRFKGPHRSVAGT